MKPPRIAVLLIAVAAVGHAACAAKLSVGKPRDLAGDEPDGGVQAPAPARALMDAGSLEAPADPVGTGGGGGGPPALVVGDAGGTSVGGVFTDPAPAMTASSADVGGGGSDEMDPVAGAGSGSGGNPGSGGGLAGTAGDGLAGATTDDGNGWVDEATPTEPAPGSSDGCPEGPLHPDGECDLPGLTCAYHFEPTEYQECSCVRVLGNQTHWECFTAGTQQQESCPAEAPEAGSDCFGYYGLSCWYPPQIDCACDAEPGYWECLMPPETEVADPPATVDPEVSISAMTSEQQQDWCLWYAELAAGGPGHPATPDLPVSETGTTTNGACRIGSYCQAAVPVLSAAQCAANLALSECDVPLSMLSECVADVLSGFCSAAQYACIDFLDSPQCPGTMVAVVSSGVPMCGVAVE